MTEYICGHCPDSGDAYRSSNEPDVRIHITQSSDAHHEGVVGKSPEAIVLRGSSQDDGTLTMPLAETEAEDEIAERVYMVALQFPHLTDSQISELTSHATSTVSKKIQQNTRIQVERDYRILEYFREGQPYDGERELATDETEREIIEYVRENPSKNADEVIEALGISWDEGQIKALCREKMLPPELPSREHHHQIIMASYEYARQNDISIDELEPDDVNISAITREIDVTWGTVRRILQEYPIQKYDPDKIDELIFGKELREEYEHLVKGEVIEEEESIDEGVVDESVSKASDTDDTPDVVDEDSLPPQRYESGNAAFEGEPIDATMQHISERPVKQGQSANSDSENIAIASESDDTSSKRQSPAATGKTVESPSDTKSQGEESITMGPEPEAILASTTDDVDTEENEDDKVTSTELSDEDIVYLIRLVADDDDTHDYDGLIKRLAMKI